MTAGTVRSPILGIKKREMCMMYCFSSVAYCESLLCTTAARDSQETPWSLCIIFHPKVLGMRRTGHKYHWCQKSG